MTKPKVKKIGDQYYIVSGKEILDCFPSRKIANQELKANIIFFTFVAGEKNKEKADAEYGKYPPGYMQGHGAA